MCGSAVGLFVCGCVRLLSLCGSFVLHLHSAARPSQCSYSANKESGRGREREGHARTHPRARRRERKRKRGREREVGCAWRGEREREREAESSWERLCSSSIRLLLTLRGGGARGKAVLWWLRSALLCSPDTDARIRSAPTAGKMVFPLHMVTLSTLCVFGGASAATHCEYLRRSSPVSSSSSSSSPSPLLLLILTEEPHNPAGAKFPSSILRFPPSSSPSVLPLRRRRRRRCVAGAS